MRDRQFSITVSKTSTLERYPSAVYLGRPRGDNTYKLKHSSKNTKKESPALPYRICPQEAIDQGREVLGGSCMAIQLPKHPLLMVDDPIVGDIEDV
jgi:hypothetical protein